MTKAQEEFETYTLTPFGCAKCGSSACIVIPLMKNLTQTDEPGLLISCHTCGEEIGMITITTAAYQLLLKNELEIVRREGQTEKNTI
jgi:hypothetical protein